MANRLSQLSTSMIYNQGYQAFKGVADDMTAQLPAVDLNQILTQSNARDVIQSLAPQVLYFSLKQKGVGDCLEVLPYLSSEQCIKIFDYDVWQQDRLCPKQAFYWLSLYNKVGGEQLVKRLSQLDEEYQLAIFASCVRFYDKASYEQLIEAEQDLLYAFPGNEMYYAILSDDPLLHDSIKETMESLIASQLPYAISLLTHASACPPNEAEDLLAQFRRARLEEDGFVTEEESRDYFGPTSYASIDKFKRKYETYSVASVNPSVKQDSLFLNRVLALIADQETKEAVRISFAQLANALCSASQIETDDLPALKKVMDHGYGTVSLALEFVSAGNVQQAAEILSQEYPKTLFKVGLGLVENLRQQLSNSLAEFGFVDNRFVNENLSLQKFGVVLDYLDQQLLAFWGLRYTETIKCLYNRYLLYPKFVNDKNNVSQLYFSPIKTVKQLDHLIVQVKVITCLMILIHRSGIDRKLMKSQSLDQIFLNCIARVGLGGLFVYKDFKAEEVSELFSLDEVKTKESVSHFLVSIENFCVNSGLDSNLHIDKSHLLFVREYLFSVFQQFKTAKKAGLNELKKMLLQKK